MTRQTMMRQYRLWAVNLMRVFSGIYGLLGIATLVLALLFVSETLIASVVVRQVNAFPTIYIIFGLVIASISLLRVSIGFWNYERGSWLTAVIAHGLLCIVPVGIAAARDAATILSQPAPWISFVSAAALFLLLLPDVRVIFARRRG